MYDYHIHSTYSLDSREKMETTVKKALAVGLKEIVFTDHIEFESGYFHEIFDVPEYKREIEGLQQKYPHISIKTGVEIGFQPHLLNLCNEFTKAHDFDFIIGSVHTVGHSDLYMGNIFKNSGPKAGINKYFEELYYVIRDGAIFNVAGHFDLVKRYVEYDCPSVFKENFDLIEASFKKLIERGMGIEINTSGFRYGLNSPHPSEDFLRLYKEMKGEIITIGSDSHRAETLAYKFDYVYALLEKLGFKYVSTFDKGKVSFSKL